VGYFFVLRFVREQLWGVVCTGIRHECKKFIMKALNAFQGGDFMAMLTVRNLPDEVHRALQMRAAQHGRSTEAEVSEILVAAVRPLTRVRLGDALGALGRDAGMTNADWDILDQVIRKMRPEPPRLE
jgi:plasmid stability protein